MSATLQQSLLPRELPQIEQVTVAVRYRASAAHAQVGGDWYDVVATPGGGATLVVGDVQGHSLAAAAVMGQLRTALHAYLSEGHHPDVAPDQGEPADEPAGPVRAGHLRHLRPGPTDRVRPHRAGGAPACRSCAGLTAASARWTSSGGVPLGVMDQAAWPVTTVTLEAGDRLLLYTDGLVERRNADLDEGVARLLQAVQDGRAGRTAEEGCDDILAVLQADLSDDVALLVCDYAGPVEGRAAVTITLPSDLSAIGDARAFVTATLECWSLVRLRDTVALLTSELVTNALVHTDGPVTLELRRDGGTVRLRVTDADTRPPRVHTGAGPDLEADGGRGMILVEALSSVWGVEPSGSGKTVWADVDLAT